MPNVSPFNKHWTLIHFKINVESSLMYFISLTFAEANFISDNNQQACLFGNMDKAFQKGALLGKFHPFSSVSQ